MPPSFRNLIDQMAEAEHDISPQQRFDNAEQYLIELLRLYRNSKILTIDHRDRGVMTVDAMYFVRREMAASKLSFPLEEAHKESDKIKVKNTPSWMITVLFQRAFIEYKRAYAALIIKDEGYEGFALQLLSEADSRYEWMKEHFSSFETAEIVPFYENNALDSILEPHDPQQESAMAFLREIGIKSITGSSELNRVFYELCIRGRELDKPMSDILLAISIDKEKTQKILKNTQGDLNDFVNYRYKGRYPFPKLTQKYENEIRQLYNRVNKLGERVFRQQEKAKRYKPKLKVGQKFLSQLVFTESRYHNLFNFELDSDRREFIGWFEMAKAQIKESSITVMHDRWRFSAEAWDEFEKLINEHNARFADCVEEKETDDL